MINADRTKLKQVLLNILTNAVKFTREEGAVSLRITAPAGAGIRFEVSDNGIGMTAEEIPLALEPFVQVDNEVSRSQEGTGLGLPMAKMLVELHGGTLTLESTPGEGTQVAVTLPEDRVIRENTAAA